MDRWLAQEYSIVTEYIFIHAFESISLKVSFQNII